MKTLDVTGLSCPEPVVRTLAALKALPSGETLTVVADTATARDNIVRTAADRGCGTIVETAGGQFRVMVEKP